MKHKAGAVLVLCLAAVTMLAIAASPAAAGVGGQPQVGTPDMTFVHLQDGDVFSGGWGWGGSTTYAPGTPIPAQDFISGWDEAANPDRSLVEQFPQIFLLTLTVKAANGEVVVATTEVQSAQFWGTVAWDPFFAMWARHWLVPFGYLSPGTYRFTYVVRQTTTMTFIDPATGELIVLKPWKAIIKQSFTVQ